MQPLRVIDIRPGVRYEQALFLPSGQKVIAGGMLVTPRTIDYLRRQSATEVYLADSAEQVVEALRHAGGNGSRSDGERDAHRARDEAEQARDQTADVANADPQEWDGQDDSSEDGAARRAKCRKQIIAETDRAGQRLHHRVEHLSLRIAPEEQEVWDFHTPGDAPWPEEAALIERRERRVATIRRVYRALEHGESCTSAELEAVVDQLYAELLDHRERFTQLALLCPRREDYLPDHAMCVVVLAMGTAAQLRWPEPAVKQAGLAAMLADVGMMFIPHRIRTGGEQLSELDRSRVQRHPAYSVALLERIENLPPMVALAAWQHHERENGTGYPHQLRGEAICDPARVLAVCDVFAALTSPRRYRENLLPYVAMEQMVRQASAGQFHKPACRAMCQAAGLFPVGSFVRLSNRKVARVLAANPNQLDRPTVQVLDGYGQPVGPPLELGRMPTEAIRVVRATAAPGVGQPA